jgi:hypothetical protein
MACYTDALVWVTKYHSGLDLWINVFTMSGTAPSCTDYAGWLEHAFQQYEVFACVQSRNALARPVAALPRLRATGVFLVPAPMCVPAPFTQATAPIPPAVVLMDVDWIHARMFPHTCFHCGAVEHLAHDCLITANVQHAEFLDRVICQLSNNLLGKLFTCLSTTTSLLAEPIDKETDPVGFPPRLSEQCTLSHVP